MSLNGCYPVHLRQIDKILEPGYEEVGTKF